MVLRLRQGNVDQLLEQMPLTLFEDDDFALLEPMAPGLRMSWTILNTAPYARVLKVRFHFQELEHPGLK